MIILGITGGIGSGKSHVSRLLMQKGIPVYCCDDEAKRLTLSDASIQSELIALLGDEIYFQDGTLNKTLLADYLFALPQHAQQVNAIIHPVVKADFVQWTQANACSDILAMESAILYESGFDSLVNKVLLIDAPQALRIKRVMQRDGAGLQQIELRMKQQRSNEYKTKRADYVIHNNEVDPLGPQIEKLLQSLKTSLF